MQEEILARPVVSIIARDEAGTAELVLLQRRTKGNPNGRFYGLWELPQGKMRAGETLFECAARELYEEAELEALSLHPMHAGSGHAYAAQMESFRPLTCVLDSEFHCMCMAIVMFTRGVPVDTPEASEHRWVDAASVAQLIRQQEVFHLNVPMLEAYFALGDQF
ncbi:MAG: NUDIX hydrolase [Geobacteraceae bacterium]|nr:NUDIX hydrolase [Geobacteraceae bacterium]